MTLRAPAGSFSTLDLRLGAGTGYRLPSASPRAGHLNAPLVRFYDQDALAVRARPAVGSVGVAEGLRRRKPET